MRWHRLKACATLLFTICAIAAVGSPSDDPAAERIAAARKAITSNPKSWQAHIDLALEFCRKARDSEQAEYYKSARAEVESALKISPGSYEARKAEAQILLGEGALQEALSLAKELNRKTLDDIAVWALLAGINAQLGNYDEAVRDAQWVLDLRPGSTLGFEEAALLREDYGDAEGAIEFHQEALRRTPLGDTIQRAWLLTRIGSVALGSGNTKAAEQDFEEAVKTNPQSRVAAAGLAQAWIAEQDYARAIPVLKERFEALQDGSSLYDLACALDRAEHRQEADAAFAQLEEMARQNAGNANLELVYFYADRGHNAAEALRIAQREAGLRHDYRTLAACAWALYVNSKFTEADKMMQRALATGNRDADRFCRAARISSGAGDSKSAIRYAAEANSMRAGSCAVSAL